MIKQDLSSQLIEKFGSKLFHRAEKFPNNKISIIYFRETPIKIKTLILENEREFHLIVNKKKGEIFHDCPSFLINTERTDKICIHFIKLLLLIKENIALKILNDLNGYNLTSEDFGSKKKSNNYLLLANACFEGHNNVEGLSYLNKAIINQSNCESIIERYLQEAIKDNLYIEFFEFLRTSFENELEEYLDKYNDQIERGFRSFINCVSDYSFFNLIRIIDSLDKIFNFKDVKLAAPLINKFKKMVNSNKFNEKYFAIYFIKRNIEKLVESNDDFNYVFSKIQLDSLKNELLNYFFTEIDNFCVIEKLKLLKKQFEVIGIPKNKYDDDYKNYKNEIKELEKKVYLRKFALLKLLIEKYDIKKTKGEFRKKRNTYVIKHEENNLNNPVYNYILSRIGFFGLNESTIKSSEIGVNYYIIKELFSDDFTNFPDVFYYRKQFWGENDNYEINSRDGFSLLSQNIKYSYNIDQRYSNKDVMIVEWDLASKPIQGSIVNAYGSQIIIPDQNNPLFHDLKPFDLCYCKKTPVKIEGNIIKTINMITKCSFEDAIKSITNGMKFIEGFYPLSLVRDVLNKTINPFIAYEMIVNNPNRIFIPNFSQFINAFRKFLFNFVKKEKDYIFEELKKNIPKNTIYQILILLNLTNELAGLNLPFSNIIEDLFGQDINTSEFKSRFLNEIHSQINKILDEHYTNIGSTIVFNLEKMRNTQFFKYSKEILKIRKEEFESAKIIKFEDSYSLIDIRRTYYGRQFLKILKLGERPIIYPKTFKIFKEYALRLNLKLNFREETKKIS